MGMHIFNSLRLFLSQYTLLFIMLMIIYSRYFFFYIGIYPFNIPLFLIFYLLVSALLIVSNYGYYYLLTTEKDKENPRTYCVTEIQDLSVRYANIIMNTYVLAFLLAFQATLIGFISLIISLFFIFGLFKDNEILFFNPILFLMNYRIYKIRVKEHNKSIYLIYKEKIQERDYIRVRHLYENIYLDERIIKRKR